MDQWSLQNANSNTGTGSTRFQELQTRIAQIGYEHHAQTILENSRRNTPFIKKTIRDVEPDNTPTLILSAGPSLYRQRILERLGGFTGRLVATDGVYIQCLKAGIKPDWVVTIDPHPTRIVNWFGDPNFKETDEYFQRQVDIDPRFRAAGAAQNAENIKTVDAHSGNLAIATSAPENVVARTEAFDRYFFTPLVDKPVAGSLTRQIAEETKCPALNTGGTVGSAAWNFARSILGAKNIAVVGHDFGYPAGTKLEQTQEWNLLKHEENVHDFYPVRNGHWGAGFTSPTYAWYLQNFLSMLDGERVINCSGGGFLQGDNVDCMELETWLKSCS